MTSLTGAARKSLLPWLIVGGMLLTSILGAAEESSLPTDAECTAFGQKLAGLFDTGKAAEAVDLLDRVRFAARVTVGLGLSQEDELLFKQGLLKNLSGNLAQQFGTFTKARFLRLQKLNGETRALVRLVSNDGAASYTSFICVLDRTKALRWSDAYLYIAGSTLSEATRTTALPLIAEMKKSRLEKITTKENAFAANIGKIQQASAAMQKGENSSALAICDQLPRDVQLHRMVLILRLRAAQPLAEAKYLKVIQDWQGAYPNDPTLDFISIDGAVIRKDYPAALQHIAAFGKQIGGDTYLDYLSGNVLFLAEKFDEARVVARKVLTDEPSLVGAYDTLLGISLKTKRYAETIAVLEDFQTHYPAVDVKQEMVSGDEFSDFRRSPEFLAWTKSKPADKAIPRK